MLRHCCILFLFLATLSAVSTNTTCKTSPSDVTWPSTAEWTALNRSIHGTLLKTAPAASSCYPGNPFGSDENCTQHLAITRQPLSTQSYWSYNKPNPLSSQAVGSGGLFTSRLLGRNELTDTPKETLVTYLRQILVSQDPTTAGSMLVFGLHAGPGPSSTPENMRGSVLPAWRSAYALVMAYGASVNGTDNPGKALAAAARWHETTTEPVWRNWAPATGAYMNEGNAFTSTWKPDFYGENYDRLLEIKRKYDPTESLFVWSGVGSDLWDYVLKSGLLCRVTPA